MNLATADWLTIFVFIYLHLDATIFFSFLLSLSKCLLLYEQALLLILLWLNDKI